jgi:flagellar hook-associated protein 1 FlgK
MGNGIFGIGLSGLAAAQAGLMTASHNISNANTPGYSRQVTMQAAAIPQFTGSGYVGSGVNVTTVQRVYSDFLGGQLNRAQASASQLGTYSTQLGSLDNLFGNAKNGLGPALDDFFAAVNTVAQQPADAASRQAMLSSAQALVSRFGQQAGLLDELRGSSNAQIQSAVTAINGATTQIAELNRRIAEASGGTGHLPNDLLDQRDQLVAQLNQQIGANVVVQSDGSYNVFMSNGQALVVGQTAQPLIARANPDDPQNLEVGLQTGSAVLRFSAGTLTGGALGGVLSFRDGPLDQAQDVLGRIAVNVGAAFNAQHAQGVDLTGSFGGDFFTVPAPVVTSATSNGGSGQVSATIQSAGALEASDYRLSYDGSGYTLLRLADGTSQSFATLPQTVDGLTLGISGAPAAGDRFLIQPVHDAAANLEVALTDPARIAAASPVVTGIGTANVGNATIGAATTSASYAGAPLGGAVTLTYDKSTGMLAASPATGGFPMAYSPGATISFGGISLSIAGTPGDGDTFTVAPNTSGRGDNRNALALAGLANRATVANGTATFSAAYGQLVAAVGNQTQEATIESSAQQALVDQTHAAQQSISGVNLDEEAANLQRYQQAYQAAGKALAIAGTLFDTILAIGN